MGKALETIAIPNCTVTLTGASFEESISFDEWLEIGRKAVRVSYAIQWLIGDWLNFGWKTYVDKSGTEDPVYRVKYKNAVDNLPYEYITLRHFSWVSRSVDLCRRRHELSFNHHQEVASLRPKQQSHYLAMAVEHGLSVADLRELIRSGAPKAANADVEKPNPSPSSWASKLSIWFLNQKLSQWTDDRRKAWKEELRPLVEIYNRL